MKTIAVIGGGASGMTAALTAAEAEGMRVILFERQQRVGKKLSATGNGRCNLTNTSPLAGRYHGENPAFPEQAFSRFGAREATAFFKELGLLTTEEYGGRVYPLSDSANSVVDVLRHACDSRGVQTRTSETVLKLEKNGKSFIVTTEQDRLEADCVIVACGGAAGAKLGGVSSGYELLQQLGHSKTALYPALAPITTEGDYPKALKGVRADAELRLISKGKLLGSSKGELQFTEKGVSGPVAFDVSRQAAKAAGTGAELHADFFADYTREEIRELLSARSKACPQLTCAEIFTGMLQGRLGNMVVKYSGTDRNLPLSALTEKDTVRLAAAAKDFVLKVKGTGSFDSAQVTAGGISTAEFRPDTLESRLVPGLFACGEVLDVDGDCGGFNLQWAWASGRLAGRLGE